MRLLTYSTATAKPRVGVLARNGRIIDLGRGARAAGLALPFDATSMLNLIESGAKGLAAARKAAAAAKEGHHDADAVHIHAPIPRPRKNVFCVGWNYVEHFEEGAKARPHVQEMPAHPAFFTKAPTSVNGPYDVVPAHAGVTEKLDWEVELGVIIGRGGIGIAETAAMKHVFGYCVINDVSARDIQRRHGQQWFKGKTLDGHCPMGPWIVTADEVKAPHDLRVTCRVNGVTKQDSNTRHMYFRIPRLLAELSAGMTLEPGDILSSGTPAGVGHARNPPEFMKPGDILETEIPGIGLLRNRIGRQ
jgi:2-keto-4-pentenoate hydratase/2-oxohepta-3-ene-1,7-dioic acid hydratase in catechol pathway